MSNVFIPTRFQWRKDTSANWASNNPIPLQGEPCLETDTGLYKIGDGVTNYASLLHSGALLDLTGISDGQVMAWDAATGKFTPASAGGGGSSDPTLQLVDPLYDFLAKPPASATAAAGASYPWIANFSASGAPSISSVDGGAAAPGVWRLATGTASSGRASLILGDLPNITLGAGLIRLPFRFRVPTLSDASNRFIAQAGFRDSWSSGVTNALFFSYSDNVNGGALVLEAWVGGVKTSVNGSTALTAGTWVSGVLEAAEDGSEAKLYIGASVEATVSSGLPTGAMSVGAIMNKTVGTVSRNFDLDYLGPLAITFTTPR